MPSALAPAAVVWEGGRAGWIPAIAATSDCGRKPKDDEESMSSSLAALGLLPVTSSGAAAAAVAVAVAPSVALACDCASASRKLGPLALLEGVELLLALEAEPAVADFWVEDVFCWACELAAVFLPCVVAVALRVEDPLAGLPDAFAALPPEPPAELLAEPPPE